MENKIIFTALLSDYEEIKQPSVVTEGWGYLFYTDQQIQSDIWQRRYMKSTDNILDARTIKIIGTRSPQSIWVDASFTINCDLDDFWKKYFKPPITVMRHPVRNCIYREAAICINRGLDEDNVIKQITRYKKEGVPGTSGLAATGILLRDDSKEAHDFCNLWYSEMINGSTRDQLSFAYAAWKMPGVVNYIDYDYRTGKEFIYAKHYNRR